MKKRKLFITILLMGIAFGINYFISFFLTSYVTTTVGTEAYGYVSLAKTFVSYAVIATTALNSYSSRYIAMEYHKGEIRTANIYFNSVFWANIVIGIVMVLLCGIMNLFLKMLLKVPDDLIYDVRILFILVFVNLFFSLSTTAFQAAAIIKDKLAVVSVFRAVSYIVEAIVLLMLFHLMPTHIFYVGAGMICSTMVLVFTNWYITKKYTPELNVSIKDFRISIVGTLVVQGVWNSLNSLGNTLNSGLDLLVSNALLSGAAMGQVSIVKTMVNIFNSLYQMVAQPFQPTFLKDYSADNKEKLLNELKFSMKVSGFVSNIAFAGVVAFGRCYYRLWLPKQDCELLYQLTVIAVATCIFEGAVYPLYYIYTLKIKNKIPCIITIIGGTLNVAGMYLLIRWTDIGIYAVFLTTAVIMLTINGITNPVYMAHCMQIHWSSFYPVLARHIFSCILMTIVLKGAARILKPDSWGVLILSVIVSCIIGAAIQIVVMFDKQDKVKMIELIKSKAKGKLKRG